MAQVIKVIKESSKVSCRILVLQLRPTILAKVLHRLDKVEFYAKLKPITKMVDGSNEEYRLKNQNF